MHHLFSPAGQAALTTVMAHRPLLAFDFDGTLSPIVARPEEARISQGVAARLRRLSALLPLAIVTGRAISDVRGRLGFEPRYIVGNHGAEDDSDPHGTSAHSAALDPLREQLRACAGRWSDAGISIEDKGPSIALHYRLARDRAQARALITALLDAAAPPWHVFPGKMVVNVAAPGAPDKAHAVHGLVARSGSSCALFAGDDANDEPVFAMAPASWLTLRVGRDDTGTHARFFLDGPHEMALLLDRMQALLATP